MKQEMAKHRVPGLSLAVIQDGRVLSARGYGLANIELAVPAERDTVYEVASLTKPITATAIMMLVEEGRLSLDDRLSKYWADLPAAWGNITVRHLLTHTSGIKDYFSIPAFHSKSRFVWWQDYTHDEVYQLIAQAPLEFQPGDKHVYSNTGYYLLGMLIEKVSGKTYEQFLAERIFQPTGMTATRLMNRSEIISKRASGYTWKDSVLRSAEYTSASWAYSQGGLVSTVPDLAKWVIALDAAKLLRRSSLEQMWVATRLNDGTTANYGLGWNIGADTARRQVYHSGNLPGFSAFIRHYPNERLTVILLSNVDKGVDTGGLTYQIAAIYYPAPKPTEKSKSQKIDH